MILRLEFSEWLLESSIESDLGMRFAIWNLDLALRHFAFFKHSFLYKNRLLKRVSYLLIFVIQKKEFFYIRDPLFFPFVNRARTPPFPVQPSCNNTRCLLFVSSLVVLTIKREVQSLVSAECLSDHISR